MTMKRYFVAAVGVAFCLGAVNAGAQEEEGGNISRIYIVHVKEGHGQQFRDGVKEYLACYGENDGEKPWTGWSAETGTMGRYAFTTGGHEWGDFDGTEPADEACAEIFYGKFLPHIAHTQGEFTEYMPDVSYEREGEDNSLVEVINFEIKDMRRFMGAIGKVAEAARESEWHNGHYWYSTWAGGRKAGDMFVALPESNFAGFGDNDGFWDMVGEHHGEEAMEQIRADFVATIQDSWSDIWRKDAELSYDPEGSE